MTTLKLGDKMRTIDIAKRKVYVVTAMWSGTLWYLRSTVWVEDRKRADEFSSVEDAEAAKAAAARFKPARFNRQVVIVGEDA